MRSFAFTAVLLLLSAACASTQPVRMEEPRRVVGTENDVRIDAEVYGENLTTNQTLTINYDITNNRPTTIAIADIIPETAYDPETRIVMVNIGSEVPGAQLLPRLVTIAPGEKKSFTVGARINFPIVVNQAGGRPAPNQLGLKVHFLGTTDEFSSLLNIPEKAVHDPKLADKLFPIWIERNEVIVTNTLPMRWAPGDPSMMPADMRGGRRRAPVRP
ncbi:MAG TPA: hypothetical protein VF618_25040 [Thermoanaerobaculia bacterium]